MQRDFPHEIKRMIVNRYLDMIIIRHCDKKILILNFYKKHKNDVY